MNASSLARIAPALLVLLALLPWTWLAYENRDLPQFGKYQDDGLFLIGAKSLHDGEGYRISSLPGKPFQTKYQPLYSALLAAMWTPNLELFALLQWVIVTGFLLLAFALMRSFGFEPWKSALMTAFLAINPWLLYWGLIPISDFLFAGLVVSVFSLLRKTVQTPLLCFAIGLLAAAAYLSKVAGILIVPAVLLGILAKRRHHPEHWKSGIVFSLPILAAFASWTLWAQLHKTNVEHSVMWYYTDYLEFFLKNDGVTALPQIVQMNLTSLLMLAGDSVLHNLSESMPGRFLSVIIFAAAVSGVRRLVRRTGSLEYPAFCGLLLLLLLVWNFSPNVRLAAPVMPLFAMGLWEEAEHLARLIAQSIRSAKRSDRVAAYLMRWGVLAGLVCAAVFNVQFIVRGLPQLFQGDRVISAQEQALFTWCKQSLPPSSVVMANNDTRLYLTTGLTAIRPVPNSVAFYKNDVPGQLAIFNHIDEFEEKFGITHMILTPADFGDFESPQRTEITQKLLADPRHRVIFRSGDSAVLEIQRSSQTSIGPVSSSTSSR